MQRIYYKINDGDWQEYELHVIEVTAVTINGATSHTWNEGVETTAFTHEYDGVYTIEYGRYGSVLYVNGDIELHGGEKPRVGGTLYYDQYSSTGSTTAECLISDVVQVGGPDTLQLNVNAGDVIQLKRDEEDLEIPEEYGNWDYQNLEWDTTFKFNASGNPASFVVGDEYKKEDTYCTLSGFFSNYWGVSGKKVVNAENIILPKSVSSFESMFNSCQELTVAPSIPNVIHNQGMFNNMFAGCTSLVNAPALPAKELTEACYENMFAGCTSLVNAPALPARTLYPGCYRSMFAGCTSLVQTPEITIDNFYISTSKNNHCYDMFSGCTALTNIRLNVAATSIPDYAFQRMFFGCTSLVDINFPLGQNATGFSNSCCYSMFEGCTSLVNANMTIGNAETNMSTNNNGVLYRMFYGCTSLVTPPRLPSLVLGEDCYYQMFAGCTSLVTAPELPATEAAEGCYAYMFSGCTSLVNAPELPATNLVDMHTLYPTGQYQGMFAGCTSLVTAPELPALELDTAAYQGMFSGCTSLVNAPSVLPATRIGATYSSWSATVYGYMFAGCTSLVKAPDIMVETMTEYCCKNMFSGCTQLNYVKCMTTNHSATSCTNNWLNGVASTGTFVRPSGVSWARNVSGVPSGWTLQTP